MKPNFVHDCPDCIFLGSGTVGERTYDFYTCPKEHPSMGVNCIARFSDVGPSYASLTCSISLWEASLNAHDEKRPRPSIEHPWVPELLECWRRAKMRAFHPNTDFPGRTLTGRIDSAGPPMRNLSIHATESDSVQRYTRALREGRDVHREAAAALLVPSVHVVAAHVMDQEGRLLVGKRSGKNHHGEWEFPGGKVEPGEAGYEALMRELEEELGIVALVLRPLCTWKNDAHDPPYEIVLYEAASRDKPRAGNSHSELAWKTVEELRALPPEEQTPSLVPLLDLLYP